MWYACTSFLSRPSLITNTHTGSHFTSGSPPAAIQGSMLVKESELRGRIILIISMPIFLTTMVKVQGLYYSVG